MIPKSPSVAENDQRLKEASKMYEKYFLQQMVKAMRKTVQHSEMTKPSMAQQIYLDKQFQQYVDSWGDNGGVGLGDMIYKQIKETHFKSHVPRPEGPLPVNPHKVVPLKGQGQDTSFLLQAPAGSHKVLSPWSGIVENQFQDALGRQFVRLNHEESGLQSLISFVGAPTALEPGQKVQGGDVLGVLSPENTSLAWKITDPSKA